MKLKDNIEIHRDPGRYDGTVSIRMNLKLNLWVRKTVSEDMLALRGDARPVMEAALGSGYLELLSYVYGPLFDEASRLRKILAELACISEVPFDNIEAIKDVCECLEAIATGKAELTDD